MGFLRCAESHDNFSGVSGHRVIPAAFRDGFTGIEIFVTIVTVVHIQNVEDVAPTVVPDSVAGICSEDEPGRIEGVIIKEIKLLMDSGLDACILIGICALRYCEVNMEAGPCGFTVLLEHVMPAGNNGEIDICKHLFHIRCGNPLIRVFRVVIVTIHHDDVGFDEVCVAALVVSKLSADMVFLYSL